eukprot:CAMPEP_0176354150 /NCGR_PEP_ID=MMETSP0126-20121128/12335_1 /TAXON_ID=141414 ORGANISM="Strombidinopsis acuminatum, Strain SPMC142" /NCGR_SAMPLE_ID=MMETSP0126 /ASSEMBLY_ACC=CAM_ASM_000229 /LENGTH=86 /DNA_ID=CAMNT_0017706169 /DNA_START=2666 /DNA_END=2926 /DNA_ORIENTATION=-
MTFALVTIVLMELLFKELLKKMGFSMSSTEIDVDENLPNFFQAVKLSDADWVVYENRNMRDEYGFKLVPDNVYQKLDATEIPQNPI